jgi:hypothetical protein
MASELIASEDISPDVMAPEVMAPEVIASDVMAAELSAAAEVLLVAVVELDPQAARVRAKAAPATRVRARFINIYCSLRGRRRESAFDEARGFSKSQLHQW